MEKTIDKDLQKVVDICNNGNGIFGIKDDLSKVFGKNNVSFWDFYSLIVKTKNCRKIFIASPNNVEVDGSEVSVQNGGLLVGYVK
jgi:hypothetical protein